MRIPRNRCGQHGPSGSGKSTLPSTPLPMAAPLRRKCPLPAILDQGEADVDPDRPHPAILAEDSVSHPGRRWGGHEIYDHLRSSRASEPACPAARALWSHRRGVGSRSALARPRHDAVVPLPRARAQGRLPQGLAAGCREGYLRPHRRPGVSLEERVSLDPRPPSRRGAHRPVALRPGSEKRPLRAREGAPPGRRRVMSRSRGRAFYSRAGLCRLLRFASDLSPRAFSLTSVGAARPAKTRLALDVDWARGPTRTVARRRRHPRGSAYGPAGPRSSRSAQRLGFSLRLRSRRSARAAGPPSGTDRSGGPTGCAAARSFCCWSVAVAEEAGPPDGGDCLSTKSGPPGLRTCVDAAGRVGARKPAVPWACAHRDSCVCPSRGGGRLAALVLSSATTVAERLLPGSCRARFSVLGLGYLNPRRPRLLSPAAGTSSAASQSAAMQGSFTSPPSPPSDCTSAQPRLLATLTGIGTSATRRGRRARRRRSAPRWGATGKARRKWG